nr:hypothetical protein [Tanacetum cinerariifolium]
MTPISVLFKPDTTPIVGNPQNNIDDKGYWDSGCSRYMTGNISYLSEFEPYDGGYVSFGHGGENITGKGIIKTDKNKEGLGYSAVPPPPAQIYSSPKKDLSWTGLPEFVDDTVTNYCRPTPSIDA